MAYFQNQYFPISIVQMKIIYICYTIVYCFLSTIGDGQRKLTFKFEDWMVKGFGLRGTSPLQHCSELVNYVAR